MKYTVLGPGIIGSGLAVNAAMSGNDVTLYGRKPFEAIRGKIDEILDIFVDTGILTREKADECFRAIKYTNDMEAACIGADLVQECLAERLDLKKETYRRIQEACGDRQPIIASATSSMFPSVLAEGALHPEKIICGHPYNPSYILPLIEVCATLSDQETIEKAMACYKAMGKVPILCRKEAKGFIVNKVSWNALATAKDIVEEGICTVEDMDKAIMYGPGMRMAVTGQLLTMSLGVDGGFREYEKKYAGKAEASEPYLKLAEGIDEALAHRTPEEGNTPEEVIRYRDRLFAVLLKAQGFFR